MTDPWAVPISFHQHVERWPGVDSWLPELSATAARWADQWQLVPDGPVMHGWTGIVWPVQLRDGSPAVLKVSPPVAWTESEPRALEVLASQAATDRSVAGTTVSMVAALAVDVDDRAMLLPRLDSTRSLEDHPDVDEAVTVIAEVLASLTEVRPVPGVPGLAGQLDGLEKSLQDGGMVNPAAVHRAPVDRSLVDRSLVDRALGRLAELRTLIEEPARLRLLHGDCHFLNVLHSLPDDDPAWVGIDPGPLVGIIEWDPVPMLRNRWTDVAATGNPDRALRRRVDQACEITGGDRELVRACAQIQAVVALTGWGLAPDHIHHSPYSVMAGW